MCSEGITAVCKSKMHDISSKHTLLASLHVSHVGRVSNTSDKLLELKGHCSRVYWLNPILLCILYQGSTKGINLIRLPHYFLGRTGQHVHLAVPLLACMFLGERILEKKHSSRPDAPTLKGSCIASDQ